MVQASGAAECDCWLIWRRRLCLLVLQPLGSREQQVRSCMSSCALRLAVQHKALTQLVAVPAQALLDLATGQGAAAAAGSRPSSASGSASASGGPGSAGTMGVPLAQANQEQQEHPGRPVRLQLEACATTGALTYGGQLDRQLSALLAAEWCPFLVGGSNQSVQAELTAGSLTPEAVAAACSPGSSRGLPVALCVPRRQLQAAGLASAAGGAEAPGSMDALEEGPPEEEAEVWVLGQLQQVLGKRLRTALDFGAEQHSMHSSRDHSSSGSQRASMAVVRVALPPSQEQGRLNSAAFGANWAATPSSISITWPCDQLWRLDRRLSAVLCGSAGAGGISSAGSATCQQQQQQWEPGGVAAAAAAAGPGPPLAGDLVSWGVSAYCSGAAVFAAGSTAPSAPGNETGLQHKGHHHHHHQQQQRGQQQQQAAGPGRPPMPSSGPCSGLLLRVELRHVELAVLAALSGEPEMAAALQRFTPSGGTSSGSSPSGGSGSSRDAYEYLSNVWAAAAGQLRVPGTELLISGATAAAVSQALLHQWSAKKLGWVLQAPRQVAAAALESFLAAFPRLGGWLAQAAAAAEAGKGAATLAGRRRAFAVPKRADDAMVGWAGEGCKGMRVHD